MHRPGTRSSAACTRSATSRLWGGSWSGTSRRTARSAGTTRGRYQQAALASLVHERVVDGAYGEIVDELADSPNGLGREHRAMVRVVKHDRDRAVRLSPELVRRAGRAGLADQRGLGAGARGPRLQRLPARAREDDRAQDRAGRRAEGGRRALRRRLLDAFEPGMTTARARAAAERPARGARALRAARARGAEAGRRRHAPATTRATPSGTSRWGAARALASTSTPAARTSRRTPSPAARARPTCA